MTGTKAIVIKMKDRGQFRKQIDLGSASLMMTELGRRGENKVNDMQRWNRFGVGWGRK